MYAIYLAVASAIISIISGIFTIHNTLKESIKDPDNQKKRNIVIPYTTFWLMLVVCIYFTSQYISYTSYDNRVKSTIQAWNNLDSLDRDYSGKIRGVIISALELCEEKKEDHINTYTLYMTRINPIIKSDNAENKTLRDIAQELIVKLNASLPKNEQLKIH